MFAKAHHLRYMLHRQYRVESSEWAATWGWCQLLWNGPWSGHWRLVGEAHHLHCMLHRHYRVESSEWAGTGVSRSEAVPEVGAEGQLPCCCGNLFLCLQLHFAGCIVGVFLYYVVCAFGPFSLPEVSSLYLFIYIFTFLSSHFTWEHIVFATFSVSQSVMHEHPPVLWGCCWWCDCLALGTALCCNGPV